MVALYLTVGLGMIGRGNDVPYANKLQVIVEMLRDITCPVVG